MRKRTKFWGPSLKPLIYPKAYSVPRQAKPLDLSPWNPYSTVCHQKLSEVLQYGNSPISAFFYPPWGVVLNCESQDINSANKLGELALNLVSMSNTKSLIGRILYVVAAWLSESKYHVRETLPTFRESYQSALKNGDLEVVGYCDKHKSQYSYFVGQELTDL